MATANEALRRMRTICLSLPDTKETLTWGKPHFRVGEKIFCGYGEEDGRTVIGFKLEIKHAAAIIKTPGFRRAPYVGHKGWVSMDVHGVKDWDAVRGLILESYRLIAAKKSLAKLDGEAPAAARKASAARSAGGAGTRKAKARRK